MFDIQFEGSSEVVGAGDNEVVLSGSGQRRAMRLPRDIVGYSDGIGVRDPDAVATVVVE